MESTNDEMNDSEEQEFREEAKRLSQLPLDEQRKIVAMHRADCQNPKVPKRDRAFAKERADTLERLLGLGKRTEK